MTAKSSGKKRGGNYQQRQNEVNSERTNEQSGIEKLVKSILKVLAARTNDRELPFGCVGKLCALKTKDIRWLNSGKSTFETTTHRRNNIVMQSLVSFLLASVSNFFGLHCF